MSKIVKLVMPMVFALSPVVYAKGPQSLWEGFYMGLDMGGAWSSSQYRTDPGCGPVGVDCVFCNVSPDPSVANGEAVASSGSQKFHFKSANIGFHFNPTGLHQSDHGGLTTHEVQTSFFINDDHAVVDQ